MASFEPGEGGEVRRHQGLQGQAEVYVAARNLRRDRVLPEDLNPEGKPQPIAEGEQEEGPLPGENLPDYGEPEEYGKKKP